LGANLHLVRAAVRAAQFNLFCLQLIGCHCQVALVALHCRHFVLDEGEISEELVHRGLEVHGGDGVGHEQVAEKCLCKGDLAGLLALLKQWQGNEPDQPP